MRKRTQSFIEIYRHMDKIQSVHVEIVKNFWDIAKVFGIGNPNKDWCSIPIEKGLRIIRGIWVDRVNSPSGLRLERRRMKIMRNFCE